MRSIGKYLRVFVTPCLVLQPLQHMVTENTITKRTIGDLKSTRMKKQTSTWDLFPMRNSYIYEAKTDYLIYNMSTISWLVPNRSILLWCGIVSNARQISIIIGRLYVERRPKHEMEAVVGACIES